METILNVLFSGAVAACVVAAIAEYFARRRFRIDNFERLRREIQDNPKLLAVKQKLAPESPPHVALTDPEMRDYLEFFELVGVYWKKKLIDNKLLNEILADYVLDLYEHPGITDFIDKERTKLENDRYYENFVDLYKWCDQQERQEKTLTRLNRGGGTEPRFLRRIASVLCRTSS
jgi:hypothetical protein